MGPIFDHEQHQKHRFWNTAPVDPLAEAKKRGLAYTSRRPLMADSPFPFGDHLGKTMRQVPAAYLRWIDAQPWAATWRDWAPVHDYLERHPLPEPGTDNRELRTVSICVTTIEVHAHAKEVFKDGACRLYVPLEEQAPFLHAFAQGALDLRREWCRAADDTAPPHYLLTPERQNIALNAGAELVTRRQQAEHAWHWRRTHGTAGQVLVREMPDGRVQCLKHCYATKKDADTVVNRRTQGRHSYRHQRPAYLRSYECPRCGFWHLTSKPLQEPLRGNDE